MRNSRAGFSLVSTVVAVGLLGIFTFAAVKGFTDTKRHSHDLAQDVEWDLFRAQVMLVTYSTGAIGTDPLLTADGSDSVALGNPDDGKLASPIAIGRIRRVVDKERADAAALSADKSKLYYQMGEPLDESLKSSLVLSEMQITEAYNLGVETRGTVDYNKYLVRIEALPTRPPGAGHIRTPTPLTLFTNVLVESAAPFRIRFFAGRSNSTGIQGIAQKYGPDDVTRDGAIGETCSGMNFEVPPVREELGSPSDKWKFCGITGWSFDPKEGDASGYLDRHEFFLSESGGQHYINFRGHSGKGPTAGTGGPQYANWGNCYGKVEDVAFDVICVK